MYTPTSIIQFLFSIGIFGILTIQAIMLEHLMGYPAITTGLLMAPRGIAAAVAMAFTFIREIKPKLNLPSKKRIENTF